MWGGLVEGVFPVLRAEVRVGLAAGLEDVSDDVRGLRDECLALDVMGVDRAAVRGAPAGAKGVADGAGALVVTLSDSAVLVALAGVLRSWVARDRGRKITLRIGEDSVEVANPSEQEQAQLIEAWLDRHVRE